MVEIKQKEAIQTKSEGKLVWSVRNRSMYGLKEQKRQFIHILIAISNRK